MSLVTYKSSAGSGKTSTLVIEYLSIALEKPYNFRQIIALTFTIKATAEMKERLIDYLVKLKNMDSDNPEADFEYIVKAIHDRTKLSYSDIKERAKILLNNILHNYGDFGFSTIDSFVVKIVRSFAHDLKLSANFDIELDKNILINAAIESLNELIGKNKELTDFVIDFGLSQLEDEKNTNLDIPLANLAALIFDSKHYDNIDNLKNIPIENFVKIKNKLQKQISRYKTDLKAIGAEGLECISRNGLSKGDCKSSWLWNYFNKLNSGHAYIYAIDKLENKTFIKYIDEGDQWYAKSKEKTIGYTIEAAQIELLEIIIKARNYYNKELPKYIANIMIYSKITPLALIHQIKQIIEQDYEQNDVIHLSEVNRKISEVVNEQHAPFIYERIGQRYNHFLIDEFQDTSVIQWNNMLPLIDNSLAGNYKNLLVGDSKQAIYRWRDGEVEQFAQLPKLLNSDKSSINKERENLIKAMYQEHILDYNYRSKENIVNFNNQFFNSLLKTESDYVNHFFQNHIQKTHKKINTGFVSLNNIEKKNDENIRNEAILESIYSKILKLKNEQNYHLGDIAILARKNDFLAQTADYLIDKNINVVSADALFLKSSNSIQLIIKLMRITIGNNIPINSYGVLRHIHKIQNLKEPINSFNNASDFFKHLSEYGFDIDYDIVNKMEAYDFCELIISKFNLLASPNPFLYNFLDRIIALSKNKGASISAFVDYWNEKKDSLRIDLTEDRNSVKLLSIHKSKGLEFPIVIFPLIGINAKLDGRNFLWAETDDSIKELIPKTLIGDEARGQNSIFKEIVEQELNKKQLDAINMIYVACTRPTEELHILFSHEKDSQKYWEILKETDWSEERVSKSSDDILELGTEVFKEYSADDTEDKKLTITNNISNLWKDRIKLKKDISRNKTIRDKGTQLHYLLSKIDINSDIDKEIDIAIGKNKLLAEYSDEFKNIIFKLLNSEETRAFFDTKYELLNEMELLTPDNRILRPDKVVVSDNMIWVVDYKYANIDSVSDYEKQKYQKQIDQYSKYISQIYDRECEGFIWYLG